MRLNKIRKRSRAVEQAHTVSRLFAKYDIDLALVEAGVKLLNSQIQAKRRTKERADYIAKGIKYKFNPIDRLALIELIQGDDKFWQEWIKQHEIFTRTGLEDDRPTLHRPNPNGNYEFGNIAMLSQGEHQQEHSQPRKSFVVSKGEKGAVNVELKRFRSITATAEGLGLKNHEKAKKISFHDARAELDARNKEFAGRLK